MSPARRRPRGSFECPHCGAQVPRGSLSCRECGSDAESGWSDEAGDWAGGLPGGYGDGGPDDEFGDEEYEEFLRREGLSDDPRPSAETLRRQRIVVVVVLLVVAIVLAQALR